METINVFSSNGNLTVDRNTGKVIEFEGPDLAFIARFDLEEFANTYQCSKENIPSSVDILDLGYWSNEGAYEPPADDWRDLIKDLKHPSIHGLSYTVKCEKNEG